MSDGALHGITVLDLGQLVSAPYCARLFADYGADVVKVEPPDGDRARAWGPFPKDEPHAERSGLFFFLNTNKPATVSPKKIQSANTTVLSKSSYFPVSTSRMAHVDCMMIAVDGV